MKSCPQCGSRYEDDFLDQCPRDQARLEFVKDSSPTVEEPSFNGESPGFDFSNPAHDTPNEEKIDVEKKESSALGGCLAQLGWAILMVILFTFGKVCARVLMNQ